MSTAARKARKREGIKFEKPAKVGTPVELRQASIVAQWSALDGMLRRQEITRKQWRRAGKQVDRGRSAVEDEEYNVKLVVEVFDSEGMPIAALTVDESGYADPQTHFSADVEAMARRLPELAGDALDAIVQRAAWGDR